MSSPHACLTQPARQPSPGPLPPHPHPSPHLQMHAHMYACTHPHSRTHPRPHPPPRTLAPPHPAPPALLRGVAGGRIRCGVGPNRGRELGRVSEGACSYDHMHVYMHILHARTHARTHACAASLQAEHDLYEMFATATARSPAGSKRHMHGVRMAHGACMAHARQCIGSPPPPRTAALARRGSDWRPHPRCRQCAP